MTDQHEQNDTLSSAAADAPANPASSRRIAQAASIPIPTRPC